MRLPIVILFIMFITFLTITVKTIDYNDPIVVETTLIGCSEKSIQQGSIYVPIYTCLFKSIDYNKEQDVSKIEYEDNIKNIGKTYSVKIPHPREGWFILSMFTTLILGIILFVVCIYLVIVRLITRDNESYYPE